MSTIFTSSYTLPLSCAHEQKAAAMHYELALSIGMATMANKKALFLTLVDRVPWFERYWSQFFAKFDWFEMLTSLSGAYSRSRDFCAHDEDNNDTTDYFTPCACARGNYKDVWALAQCLKLSTVKNGKRSKSALDASRAVSIQAATQEILAPNSADPPSLSNEISSSNVMNLRNCTP